MIENETIYGLPVSCIIAGQSKPQRTPSDAMWQWQKYSGTDIHAVDKERRNYCFKRISVPLLESTTQHISIATTKINSLTSEPLWVNDAVEPTTQHIPTVT